MSSLYMKVAVNGLNLASIGMAITKFVTIKKEISK